MVPAHAVVTVPEASDGDAGVWCQAMDLFEEVGKMMPHVLTPRRTPDVRVRLINTPPDQAMTCLMVGLLGDTTVTT